MTTTFNLTANELKAAMVLVKSCLDGMGGQRPIDLDSDPYTWVDAKVLMDAGWNKNEAAGTFGALIEKGVVDQTDKNEWAMSDDAYRFLDTIWDEQNAEKENTVSTEATLTIAMIDLANLTVQFAANEAAADASDLYVAGSAPELEDLTGPQAVAVYNALATELNASPARGHLDPIPSVKRFADKGTACKRVWALIEEFSKYHEMPAGTDAHGEEAPVESAPPAHKANAVDVQPAVPTKTKKAAPRRGTGINLAPQKKVYACRAGSKQAILVDMLSRPQGATMVELLDALSGGTKPWKEVTVKSGLNWDMNKVKGYGIRTTKRGDEDCYHLVLPEGMTAPVPHTVKKGA